MVTTAGLAQIKTYADGISPWKPYVISSKNLDKDGNGQPDDLNKDGKFDDRDREMMTASNLVKDAHAANLFVHPFVFSNDVSTLASDFAGDPSKEYNLFYNLGVDGVFSANPSDANKAR
ncbi:glycerophosphodiester phosphodiesterase [compost metagenome]